MDLDQEIAYETSSVSKLKNKLIMEKSQKYDTNTIAIQSKTVSNHSQVNNTSRKLRRFVQNRLIDADLGQAKRSDSPNKELSDVSKYNFNNSRPTLANSPKQLNFENQRQESIKINTHKRSLPDTYKENLIDELNLLKHPSSIIINPLNEIPQVPEHNHNIAPLNHADRVQVNDIMYKKIELIGKGGTSKVYKIKRLFKADTLQMMKKKGIQSTTTFALKRVDFDQFDDASIDFFKGEINMLHKLKAKQRVVKLVDYEMKADHINLVMECGSYSLSDVLSNRRHLNFDVDFVKHHFKEVCLCLKDVHDEEIIHADLKPANFVFIRGILKIIDFGIADSIPDNTVNIYRDKQFGTPNYMAPEALVRLNNNDTNYTGSNFVFDYNSVESSEIFWKVGKPADIWSLGCILYQMVYGDPPFNHLQGGKRLKSIMDPNSSITCPAHDAKGFEIPKALTKLINQCLNKASKKRPTIDEILFYSEFLNHEKYLKTSLKAIINDTILKNQSSIERKDLIEMLNQFDLS